MATTLRTASFLLLSLSLLPGCQKNSGALKDGECIDITDCTGEMEACIGAEPEKPGKCEVVDCLESSQCGIEHYCDTKGAFTCASGCLADSDCMAGDSCNTETNACRPYGCRSSALDCEVGQICDPNSGRCQDSGQALCETCDAASLSNDCGRDAQCFITELGGNCTRDSDCDTGWHCDAGVNPDNIFQQMCHNDMCFVTCNARQGGDACAAGFQCNDVTGAGDYYCNADCTWLIDNGYL